jgi:hypothetical protein
MSSYNGGVKPSTNKDISEPDFGLDALFDASIVALIAVVEQALGSVAGQHAKHFAQLSTTSAHDVTKVAQALGKAALKAAKEHAGTARMSKASAAREVRAASATYANALADFTTAGERSDSLALPWFKLVVAAARLHLALAQYGNGPFTLNDPKSRKLRADGVVKPVDVADFSKRERELIVEAVESDETTQAGAYRALREHAVANGSAPLQQICALIDIDDRERLNKLCTAVKRSETAEQTATGLADSVPSATTEDVAATTGLSHTRVIRPIEVVPAKPLGITPNAVAVPPTSPFDHDGNDPNAVDDLVSWLAVSGRFIRAILVALPDGTIVRTEAARAASVNAQFDRAGRHPDVQASLRALIAPATSAEGESTNG